MSFSAVFGKTWLLVCGLIIVGFGLSVVLSEFIEGPRAPRSVADLGTAATVLGEPLKIPPFTLRDHHGEPFTNERLEKHWTLLFFGYTHCPDICPTTLATLATVRSKIEHEHGAPPPQTVFVSVDPERDTLDHLGEYATYFDKDFLGVTGSVEQLEQLTRPLGIAFHHEQTATPDTDYLVGHSAAILLIDPAARLRSLITPPHEPGTIAADYRIITSAFAQ